MATYKLYVNGVARPVFVPRSESRALYQSAMSRSVSRSTMPKVSAGSAAT
jgi:hypothetical protein